MATMSSLDLARQYTTFSGVDIKAIIGGAVVGEMQAVSYAVQREKAPLYVMGKVDPISFSRGKRGIAGTMISLLLDKHLIYSHPKIRESQVILDKDEIFPEVNDLINVDTANDLIGLVGDELALDENDVSKDWLAKTPHYIDQVLPFDIAIVAVSEYGKAATMRIYGVEILNEGSGFSIDDVVIENQMTYVCRSILPWRPMGEWGIGASGGKFGDFVAAGKPTAATPDSLS